MTGKLLTVGELAVFLNCTERALYELIRKNKWGPHQGVHRLFGDSKRGIRIDEALFLHWRELPETTWGDAHLQELTTRILAALLPLKTLLDTCVREFQDIYEHATKRLEDERGAGNGSGICQQGK